MGVFSDIWPYIAALLPTIGLAYLFYVVMKHIVEGDRRERIAQRQWEQEQDQQRTSEPSAADRPGPDADISRNGHS